MGQTYFAVQTRKQELVEQAGYQNLRTEDEKRIFLRDQLKVHNKQSAGVVKNAGVIAPVDYAIFQDHGYKGLYAGLTTKDIHVRKGLKKGQQILDHMGSTELAANLFRATQTEESLKETMSKTNGPPIKHIMKLARRSEKLSKRSEAQCRSAYPPLKV